MKTRTVILITLAIVLVSFSIGLFISFLLFRNTSNKNNNNDNQRLVLVDPDGNYIYEDKYIKFKFSKACKYTLNEDNNKAIILEKEFNTEVLGTYKTIIIIGYNIINTNKFNIHDYFYDNKKPVEGANVEKIFFEDLKLSNTYYNVKITYFKYEGSGIVEYSFFDKNLIVNIWIHDIYHGDFKEFSQTYSLTLEIDYILKNFQFKN
jgi:hypothetical protein